MTSQAIYDFLSEENEQKWRGMLSPALRKIQKQVHPRLEIEDEALEYLETLIFQLLAQICSVQPHALSDVETHVQATFSYPIDVWSLNEAQEKLERFAARKRGVFLFPIDKLHQQLTKEVLGYKVDVTLIQFIMGILDYVAADVLKLAGNFVKNTRKPAIMIILRDVHVSMSADPALQALFKPLQSNTEPIGSFNIGDLEVNTDRGSMKYDELLRDLMENESQFVRHLNLILKVFQPPFLENSDLFPKDEVDTIFEPVTYIYDLSVQLLASMEEMIEMASEMEGGGGTRYPQIGFCFEEIAESGEFSVYLNYTENYQQAVMELENIVKDPEVCSYFKQLADNGNLPKLFKEALQYVLPKALLEPIYHFFYYCTVMQHMSKVTEDEDDDIAFESAISGTLADKLHVERLSQRFLPRRREDVGMFGRRVGIRYSMKKLIDLQSRIEGWEGPDIHTQCTELIREGSLSITREGGRRNARQKMERYVFLLDGLIICCKLKKAGTASSLPEYKLKEKLNTRGNVELIDLDDSDDLKFAFELREEDQPGIIFITLSPPEKNEWMCAFTMLMIRSVLERMLDAKLREEERLIPVLVPDVLHYKFAEPDSEDNVIFEDEQRDNQVLIKAATIHKLVERLTYHEYADPTFVRTFLMTYRSFCKPVELLNLLIERYQIPSPLDPDDYEARRDPLQREAIKRFKTNYVSPIHLRVLNVLRHWVENHYYDFEQEPSLLEQLKDFVSTVRAKNMQKWVSSIHRALSKREGGEQVQSSKSDPVFFEPPPSIEWHITRNKDEFHILTLHPLEFARQLTLILSDLFRAIRPAELVDASWTKEHKKENSSPNLLKMSRFETKIANWLRHTIVFMENFEERVALCCRLVDIMEELRALNNFAALFALNATFQSSQIFRLNATIKELSRLSPKRKQILEEIKQLASTDKGYKNYKQTLRAINPPCVPFVGMYLSWIVFIKDGNDSKLRGKPDYFINFKKRRMIANILQEIQQYQNTPYCLKPEASIQEYLTSHDVKGDMGDNQFEDFLYDQSLEIEPREQPYKKTARKHKFDLRPPTNTQPSGTFAHFLEVATIRRPGDRKKHSNVSEEDLLTVQQATGSGGSGSESPVTPNSSQPVNGDNLDDKTPPPIPPRPHSTASALDVMSITTPPKLPPRPNSPRLESLSESFLTYRPPRHRPPPSIPNNDIVKPPPRPPKKDPVSLSPVSKDFPNIDIPPPLPPPPQRSFSPPLLPPYTDKLNSSPLPPPRPPPPVRSNSPPSFNVEMNHRDNRHTVFNYESEMTTPPAIPPRPTSSVPLMVSSPSVAPPIPPKSAR